MGETLRIRDKVLPYIKPGMCGVDLGYGGECLSPETIAVDQVNRYSHCEENSPQNLYGDARTLHWFQTGVLDYVYSSHLLEDYPPDQTERILMEWLRVIKSGGLIILYLPNEMRFRKHCDETGQPYNQSHSNPDMSLAFMLPILTSLNVEPIEWLDETDGYSFLIIGRKT